MSSRGREVKLWPVRNRSFDGVNSLALFLSKSFNMGRHMRVTCLCSLYVHSIYAMCIVPIISNCNLHVTVFHLYHKRPCRAEVNELSILDDYARNPEVISQRRIIYKRIRNCKYVKFNSLYEKIANKEKQYSRHAASSFAIFPTIYTLFDDFFLHKSLWSKRNHNLDCEGFF